MCHCFLLFQCNLYEAKIETNSVLLGSYQAKALQVLLIIKVLLLRLGSLASTIFLLPDFFLLLINFYKICYIFAGKVDATVEVKIDRRPKTRRHRPDTGNQLQSKVIPLELKTGKMFTKLGELDQFTVDVSYMINSIKPLH